MGDRKRGRRCRSGPATTRRFGLRGAQAGSGEPRERRTHRLILKKKPGRAFEERERLTLSRWKVELEKVDLEKKEKLGPLSLQTFMIKNAAAPTSSRLALRVPLLPAGDQPGRIQLVRVIGREKEQERERKSERKAKTVFFFILARSRGRGGTVPFLEKNSKKKIDRSLASLDVVATLKQSSKGGGATLRRCNVLPRARRIRGGEGEEGGVVVVKSLPLSSPLSLPTATTTSDAVAALSEASAHAAAFSLAPDAVLPLYAAFEEKATTTNGSEGGSFPPPSSSSAALHLVLAAAAGTARDAAAGSGGFLLEEHAAAAALSALRGCAALHSVVRKEKGTGERRGFFSFSSVSLSLTLHFPLSPSLSFSSMYQKKQK